jgi:peptidoglycan/xylan/chitin deacetylase (PgdA/CDA1 family)
MAMGELARAASRRPLFALGGVPVFVYHGLSRTGKVGVNGRESRYWIPLAQFQEHLILIRQAGRRVALLTELWSGPAWLEDERPAVAITFDDGLSTDYESAFPTLLEAGVRADFFVNTSTIGRPGHLTWRQIGEMQSAGMAFHSHIHDHVDLSRLSLGELEAQLGESKRRLEDHLGQAVEFLAVPYGLVSRRVLEVAWSCGYRAICTSFSWPTRPGARKLGRVAVYRHTTPQEFWGLACGEPVGYVARLARAASLYLPKQILLRCRPAQLGVRVLEKQA